MAGPTLLTALQATAQHPHLAWVFPGQGSQEVGMGRDVYERYPEAREVFQRADEVLDMPLTRLCFEGPEEDLRKTVNAQPAIVTVSLAYLAAARGKHTAVEGMPAYVAGHSLGEYSALIAASVLSFEDGITLVRERGRLMQAAGDRNPGTLAAIMGLDESALEEVCQEAGAEICNVNTGNQIVIGGEREAVLRAMDLAQARGARRAVPLNVSGAFHSSLMRPAAIGMAEAIKRIQFREPLVPIVANCSGEAVDSGEAIREELIRQVSTAVQWRRSVMSMLQSGVSTFVEIGPGRVLSGLIRQIDRNAKLFNIGKVDDISKD
ncbi:MAG: ACP S-malonyltransferase [Dehalococcoidia bacterium]